MCFGFSSIVIQDITGRQTGCLTKPTVGKQDHIVTDHFQIIQVFERTLTIYNFLKNCMCPMVTNPAGGAFSTAFVLEEVA
jgi:hypothetical protein